MNPQYRLVGVLAGTALTVAAGLFAYQWLGAGLRTGEPRAGNATVQAKAQPRPSVPSPGRGEEPLPVRVSPVRRGTVRDVIRQTATLASSRVTPVYSELSLIAREVLVEEGDAVKKGQLLVRLDDEELRLNVEQARVTLDHDAREWERRRIIRSEALEERKAYRGARFEYDAKQVLLKQKTSERMRREAEARRIALSFREQLVSEQERDDAEFAAATARLEEEQARLELRKAREEWQRIEALDARELLDQEEFIAARFAYQSSKAALALAELKVKQASVVASAAGVVTERLVNPGDFVSSNSRLMTLVDMESLEAVVYLPELHWLEVQPGQEVSVHPETLGDFRLRGRVARVNPVIDSATGTFKVTIAVDGGADGKVKPGMFVALEIQTASRPGALLIPRQAVLGEEGERFVFLAVEGKARRRAIRLGATVEERVEVRAGLRVDDLVIVAGQHRLKPGRPIKVVR